MAWGLAALAGFNLLGGISRYRQAKNQHRYQLQVRRARAKYTKQVAENHAILAEQEADDVLRSGRRATELLGRKSAQVLSGIRVGMASSGFAVDGGDAYRIEDDVRMLASEDRNEIRRQSKRQADLSRYKAAMIRHGAAYNEALSTHDPGGPSFGAYFMSSLIRAGGQAALMGAFDDLRWPFGAKSAITNPASGVWT